MTEHKRCAGILLPLSALPSRYGIGCLSASAYRFVDFLRGARQREWQLLPLGPTGYGDSPYQSFSAFAGNPYAIDLGEWIDEGLLSRKECDAADLGDNATRVDYGKLYRNRYPLLRLAYERSRSRDLTRERAFAEQNRAWLDDYALFMALKHRMNGAPLQTWSEELRLRDADALARARKELGEEIGFQIFLQERFARAWGRLRRYAHTQGIRIIGDLPIYMSSDSADVWVHPELFALNRQGAPTLLAGCPPDGFSPDGQLWGNPLYDWEAHAREGFAWWIARMRHALSLYDVVRIDHFRGFDEYYAIPANAPSAAHGTWKSGPRMALFSALRASLGEIDGIAEDLGFVTDSVRELVRESGFASMKVLQIGLDEAKDGFHSEHLPHRYTPHVAAYTGTHDHPTLLSWILEQDASQEARLRAYLCDPHTPREALCEPIIALLMRSAAERCIIPLQDYLSLGDHARINRPATATGNWQWRLRPDSLSPALQQKILRLTEIGGRES